MHLTASQKHTLLSVYNLPLEPRVLTTAPKYQCREPERNSEQAIHASLLALASDLRFHLPVLTAHDGWQTCTISPPRPAHRYHFHVRNPFPGPFHDLASHELDVAYLLQNWAQLLANEVDRAAVQGLAGAVVRFVCGEGWCDWHGEDQVTVFTSEGLKGMGTEEYDRKWRGGRGGVLREIEAEALWRVAEKWQGVRAEVT